MRKQRAFATLTEEEIDQIAGWLRHDNYDHVRERIALPRPEGFGLTISNKPLQILFGRKNTVEKINRKLETGQKLTLAEFESIAAGEKADLPEKIHNAILETTYERVLEDDNTPTQLLALQRLADFPAGADYRDHKIQMDLHRKEMAEHRKYIADERLALAKRALDLRENAPLQRPDSRNSNNLFRDPKTGRLCDDLGPIPKTPEDIRARAIKFYRFDAEELARKAQERARAQATAPPPPDLSAPINTNIHAGDSEKTEITGVSTPSDTSREPQPPHETPDLKCQMKNPQFYAQ